MASLYDTVFAFGRGGVGGDELEVMRSMMHEGRRACDPNDRRVKVK